MKLRKIADVDLNIEDRGLTRNELIERVQDKKGILSLLTDKIDAQIMDSAKQLKVISNYAVGFDNIDLKATTERGIFVTNTRVREKRIVKHLFKEDPQLVKLYFLSKVTPQ